MPKKCRVEGCTNTNMGGWGYCKLHYERQRHGRLLDAPVRRHDPSLLCIVEGCNNKRSTRKYCSPHYKRFQEGRPIDKTPLQKRQRNKNNLTFDGYVERSINGVTKSEHVWRATVALGKPLPKGAEVHHINGIRWDNRSENLVVCPNRAYHELIEKRTKALEECGHADWIRCSVCKEYDDPSNFKFYKKSGRNDNRSHNNCCKVPLSFRLKMEEMDDIAAVALSFGC